MARGYLQNQVVISWDTSCCTGTRNDQDVYVHLQLRHPSSVFNFGCDLHLQLPQNWMMDIGQETFTFGGNNNDFLWANTLSNLVVAIRIAMAIWEVVGGVQKGGVLVRLQKDRLEG